MNGGSGLRGASYLFRLRGYVRERVHKQSLVVGRLQRELSPDVKVGLMQRSIPELLHN